MTTTPPAPTLTVTIDSNPCPRVEVLVSPMPVDADTITIYRSYGGQQTTVRGASEVTVSGDFLAVDFEAPFGVDVTYSCQTEDVSGIPSAVSVPSSSVNLTVASAWAQDPLDPGSAVEWPLSRPGDTVMKLGSLTGYVFSADQSLTSTIGSSLPLGMSGVRRDAASIPLILATTTDAAHNVLLALLRQAGANLCLRLPSKIPLLPSLAYLQIGDVTPAVDPNMARVVWTFTGTSIEGPALNIVVAARTLDDVGGEASTLDGLGGIYATLIDLQRGQ